MKYQVIVIYDETRKKSYFNSYIVSDDVTFGNIECSELPPYADVNKAKACYWNKDNETWVFDEEMYQGILAKIEEEEQKRAEEEAIRESTPTTLELSDIVMELADMISTLSDAVTEVAEMVAELGGTVSTLSDSIDEINEKVSQLTNDVPNEEETI